MSDDVSNNITDRWVINKSDLQITEPQLSVLRKGLNFAVTPSKLPTVEFVTAVETACHLLGNTSNKAAELRSDCVQVLKQSKPPPSNISKEERVALRELKEDKDITILPADKGRATVILNKTDYQDKANDLLNDTNTYKPLKRDPTSMYRNQLIEVLQSLRDEGVINVITYRQLYPTSSDTPKFYGLPKVHKDACPLRPIVSSCGSITYNTAKFISKILSPLVGGTPRHLKNSEDLVTKLSAIKLADNESLVSYDVSALFTSVPVDESLDIIHKRLTNDDTLSTRTTLSPKQIIDLLRVCLKTTYFTHNGTFYTQIEGRRYGLPP
ncbi:uncharacterized protein [Amphiura filiformis]|uniref:uncharacterized protein n=1 Tax=Amphiura filiformis TaxID=82378 RepID=UPI003B226D90